MKSLRREKQLFGAKLSYSKIAFVLNGEGFCMQNGNPFCKGSVHRILTQRQPRKKKPLFSHKETTWKKLTEKLLKQTRAVSQ